MLPSSQLPFKEEDALALYGWIDDVCGDDVKFPAHWKDHFTTHKERLEKQRASVEGKYFFYKSSRSGTREITALQNMIAALKELREREVSKLASLRKEVEAVERVLLQEDVCATSRGKLNETDSADETHKELADNYIAQIERQQLAILEELTTLEERRLGLVNHSNQLQEEMRALCEKEAIFASRHAELTEALCAESDALALERASEEPDVYTKFGDVEEALLSNNTSETRKKLLCEIRLSFCEAQAEFAKLEATFEEQESVHAVRFRNASQKLKVWQEMVRQLRRTHDMLDSRVRVISTVVTNNALLLGVECGVGQMGQLRKLKNIFREKSSKFLTLNNKKEVKEEEQANCKWEKSNSDLDNSPTGLKTLFSVSATETVNSPSTPQRSRASRSSTTTVVSPTTPHSFLTSETASSSTPQKRQNRHCRPCSLLALLQQWEAALAKESACFLTICKKGLGLFNSSQPSSALLSECVQELRGLLFQTSTA